MTALAALSDLQRHTLWALHQDGPADARQVTDALVRRGAIQRTDAAVARTRRRLRHLEQFGAARVHADGERFALTPHGASLL